MKLFWVISAVLIFASSAQVALAQIYPAHDQFHPPGGIALSQATYAYTNLAVSARLHQTLDEVVSAFENGTPVVDYAYMEALGDGRGYTAGRAGFTTGTGDLLDVVELYLRRVNHPGFRALLPLLRKRAKDESDSIVGLSSLPVLWASAANDPVFRKTQDDVSDELYFKPAQKRFRQLGFRSPLALLCIYDTIIQHGEMGLDDILRQMNPLLVGESDRLYNLLDIRYTALMFPADGATAAVWRESVGRVEALRMLVREGKYRLVTPFSVNPFGEDIKIP